MTVEIIDTAENAAPQVAHLKADGIKTVFRYLTTNTASSKLISPVEAHVLAAAGIRVGLVFEAGGGAPGQSALSAAVGEIDGAFAARYASQVGAPAGACVYFAADNDFSTAQIGAEILPYFAAVTLEMAKSGFDVGVYGSGNVCSTVCQNGQAKKAWLSGSMGWGGSRAYLAMKRPELVMVQEGMDTKLANLNCDTDYTLGDIGDFMPFSVPVSAPVVASAAVAPSWWGRLMGRTA